MREVLKPQNLLNLGASIIPVQILHNSNYIFNCIDAGNYFHPLLLFFYFILTNNYY